MKDKLVTKNYIEILAANFLLYFGFYLLMPVLPFYLAEIFNSEKGTIGIILSCYTIAALCIRPFSGYLLDTFARKPLYLLAYFLFTAAFGGYLLAGTLTLFTLIRILPRLSLRNGHGSRKHGSHRHHAQFTAWRGTGILWNDEQHGNEHRPDGRTIST